MICKHFIIQQLVGPECFAARGQAAWELLDPRLLVTLDALYDNFGPMTVNNWHTGGRFKESGLRDFSTATGAKFSQHKFGRAADIKPVDIPHTEMYAEILAHPEKWPLLSTVEDIASTLSWVHIDVRSNQTPGIRIIKP